MSTVIEKWLGKPAGEIVDVTPDHMVITDGSGYSFTESFKNNVSEPEKVKIFIDHHVPSGDPAYARVMGELEKFSVQHNISYLQAKGIAYQYMLNHVVKSGEIIVGAGKHQTIYSVKGALGISVPDEILQQALAESKFSLLVPNTVKINLVGEKPNLVSIFDIALCFVRATQQSQLKGLCFEFSEEIYGKFSEHELIVFMSFMSEAGATMTVIGNSEANECKQFTFDHSSTEKVVALPESFSGRAEGCRLSPLDGVKGTSIEAAFVGGYTGGHIEDLRLAADLMRGKRVKWGVRLNISPVSSEVYLQAAEEGLLETFIDFGAQILPPGDHGRMSQGPAVLGHNEVAITTGVYNYSNCLGGINTKLFVGSVETVVSAAINGYLD